MSEHSLIPPIIESISINRYVYFLSNLIPHLSVNYSIYCYNNDLLVKTILGVVDGEQYKEWTTDDWMDAFIKSKVEALNTSA